MIKEKKMISIAVIGALGKMGKEVVACCLNDPEVEYIGGILKNSDPNDPLYQKADVLIDFSTAKAFNQNLQAALEAKTNLVIGTTGLSDSQKEFIQSASQKIPIFYAPNFSIGMFLTQKVVKELAKHFKEDTFIDIIETHHHQKKDIPSGSALLLKQLIEKEVPIHSIRAANTIGEHRIIFSTDEESIEIFHQAKTRKAFAKGAIKAAKFLNEQKPGLYSMEDLVSL